MSTSAMPVSAGSFCSSLVNASRPPADAPMPTIGKEAPRGSSLDAGAMGRLNLRGAFGADFAAFFPFLPAITHLLFIEYSTCEEFRICGFRMPGPRYPCRRVLPEIPPLAAVTARSAGVVARSGVYARVRALSKLHCARATTLLGLEHFRATADGGVLAL